MPKTLAYGAWRSPITSDLIVGESIGLGEILVDGADIYWIESRPSEAGRGETRRFPPRCAYPRRGRGVLGAQRARAAGDARRGSAQICTRCGWQAYRSHGSLRLPTKFALRYPNCQTCDLHGVE